LLTPLYIEAAQPHWRPAPVVFAALDRRCPRAARCDGRGFVKAVLDGMTQRNATASPFDADLDIKVARSRDSMARRIAGCGRICYFP